MEMGYIARCDTSISRIPHFLNPPSVASFIRSSRAKGHTKVDYMQLRANFVRRVRTRARLDSEISVVLNTTITIARLSALIMSTSQKQCLPFILLYQIIYLSSELATEEA